MLEIINEIRVSGTLQGTPELRTRVLEDKTKEYSVRGFLRQRRNSWTDENGRVNYSYNMFQFRAKLLRNYADPTHERIEQI